MAFCAGLARHDRHVDGLGRADQVVEVAVPRAAAGRDLARKRWAQQRHDGDEAGRGRDAVCLVRQGDFARLGAGAVPAGGTHVNVDRPAQQARESLGMEVLDQAVGDFGPVGVVGMPEDINFKHGRQHGGGLLGKV